MIVRTIAAKELLDQVSSPKFVFLFGVSTALVLLSLFTGSSAYVGARGEYRATEELSRQELENRRDYGELSQFGIRVARRPSALSALAGGVGSALGRSARVRSQGEPELAPSPASDAPVLAVLGELDLNVVVRVFLSLFVLLLTYDAVAGEKERGTLRALLANDVPRGQLLLGKVLGLFGTLVAAAAIPAVLGLLVMKVGFGIELAGVEWARLVAIAAACALYLLAVFAIGMLVSTLTTRTSVAFLLLLLVWVLFVEVLPKASPMVAAQFRPAPSFASLQSDRDRLQREFQRGLFRSMSAAFAQAGAAATSSPEEAEARQRVMDSLMTRGRDSLRAELDVKTARLEEAYRNRQDAFTRLALLFSRLSPAVALSHAVEVLAGTDFDVHRRWRDDLIAYRAQFQDYLKSKGVQVGGFRIAVRVGGSRSGVTLGGGPEDARLDLATLPRFRAQPEGFLSALARATPDLLIMALYASVALLLAFAGFLRYDVR